MRPRPSSLAARLPWLLPAAIALVTALAFLPSVRYGFMDWDDNAYVTENAMIRDSSLQGVGALFGTFIEGNYQPLTIASYTLDYRLWKLDPRGYHITNVVLHTLATVSVFAFVFLLTGSAALSAITSLFFGIHPLHVESVAWVSGRKDVLYALFYLLSCAAYVLWLRARGPGRPLLYAATLLGFLLSLLSKGMAVTLPVALLAVDLYLKRGWNLKLLLEKAPMFLIAIVFGYLSVVAQTRQGAVQALASYPFYERILFACYGISAYLIRAIAPAGLSAFYPYPLKTAGVPLLYALAPLGVLVLGAAIAWIARKDRAALFGALFFLVNVVLVLQLFPVGSAVIADRYTYLSFVGVGLILASAYRLLARALAERLPSAKAALLAVLVAASGLAFFATRARSEIWRNNVTLWTDVLSHYPTLPLGYTKRARTYMLEGDNERALRDVEKAIALDPNDARALTMRGTIRFIQGDNAGALSDLTKSVSLQSDDPVAWNSLGAVHLTVGDRETAQADFTRAIERNPGYAEAYLNRALARGAASPANAIEDFDAAIRFQPGNAKAYLWRSGARMQLGDRAGALQDARQAQALGYPVDHAYLEMLQRSGASPPPRTPVPRKQ